MAAMFFLSCDNFEAKTWKTVFKGGGENLNMNSHTFKESININILVIRTPPPHPFCNARSPPGIERQLVFPIGFRTTLSSI